MIMKKIIIISILFSVLFIAWCSQSKCDKKNEYVCWADWRTYRSECFATEAWKVVEYIWKCKKDYKVVLRSCKDKKMKECIPTSEKLNIETTQSNLDLQNIFDITKIDFWSGNQSENIGDQKLKEIFNEIWYSNITDMKNEKDSFLYFKANNSASTESKTYDITIDLTYFDNQTNEIEEYIKNNRLKKVNEFFEWKIDPNVSLKDWDKIILRFLWAKQSKSTWDYIVLDEKFEYFFWNAGSYKIKSSVRFNKTKWIINIYYNDPEKIEEANNKYTFIDKTILFNEIEKEFSWLYWSDNSHWTFLLNHIQKNWMFSNKDNNIVTVFFSDFLFQMHPNYLGDIKNWSVQHWWKIVDDLNYYNYSKDNIKKNRWTNTSFNALYTDRLYKIFPEFQNICWEWQRVYLIWIYVNEDLVLQKHMKDFYQNYFLKKCNVSFY